MKFELNKEYNLSVINVSASENPDDAPIRRATVKRVKIVAFPFENEMVVELVGAQRFYQGIMLPVRGRLNTSDGVSWLMHTDQTRYEVKNII